MKFKLIVLSMSSKFFFLNGRLGRLARLVACWSENNEVFNPNGVASLNIYNGVFSKSEILLHYFITTRILPKYCYQSQWKHNQIYSSKIFSISHSTMKVVEIKNKLHHKMVFQVSAKFFHFHWYYRSIGVAKNDFWTTVQRKFFLKNWWKTKLKHFAIFVFLIGI